MDFGLGFIPQPSPILEFQGGLLPMREEIPQEKPNQKKDLFLGVVLGIICCSEAMADGAAFLLTLGP